MKKKQFSHIDESGNPKMVDVSTKQVTRRTAVAEAVIKLGKEIASLMKGNEIITKKGPVFHTATVAAVMAAKNTSSLIPFCHPVMLEDVQVQIVMSGENAVITSRVICEGKTGVEMEALVAVNIAALTIYDMCKAISHDMTIGPVRLLSKTGGKRDFFRDK